MYSAFWLMFMFDIHHFCWWFFVCYDYFYLFKVGLLPRKNVTSTDLETEIVSLSVKDGQNRQQCYSHCLDRCCKKHHSLMVSGPYICISFILLACIYWFHFIGLLKMFGNAVWQCLLHLNGEQILCCQ